MYLVYNFKPTSIYVKVFVAYNFKLSKLTKGSNKLNYNMGGLKKITF